MATLSTTASINPPDLSAGLSASIGYREATDDYSPGTGGFSMEGGHWSLPLLVDDAKIDDAIVDLLGYTSTDPTLAKLKRKCPKAHPRFPWLYCSKIGNVQGRGSPTKAAGNATAEANPLTSYAGWPQWLLTADFEPRPYFVLPDSRIDTGTLSWTQEDGTTTSNAYATEWMRYTDIQVFPKPELITAQQGSMAFFTQSGATPGASSSGIIVGGVTFPGFLRQTIPQAEVRITWYQVPYFYMESANSRLASFAGTVNQFDFGPWKAGEMLYLGATAKRYTPPCRELIPDPEPYSLSTGRGATAAQAFTPAKLCDVEMVFLFTRRPATDPPAYTGNANWIAAGHNLQPWMFDRKFYYVAGANALTTSSSARASLGTTPPTFPSRPMELLFSNPNLWGRNMLGVPIDQRNLSTYHAEFTAQLITNFGDGSYLFAEVVWDQSAPGGGAYRGPNPPGRGTYQAGPSAEARQYAKAYEINRNASIDCTTAVPPTVRMWFRSDDDGGESYAFDGTGLATGGGPPPPFNAALDVKQVNPTIDFPRTGTLEFDHADGFTLSTGGGGTGSVLVKLTEKAGAIDVQQYGPFVDFPHTTVLQFDASTTGGHLAVTANGAGVAKVKYVPASPATTGVTGTYTLVESVTCSYSGLTVTSQAFTFTDGLLTSVV